jgi:hypothetical protein
MKIVMRETSAEYEIVFYVYFSVYSYKKAYLSVIYPSIVACLKIHHFLTH